MSKRKKIAVGCLAALLLAFAACAEPVQNQEEQVSDVQTETTNEEELTVNTYIPNTEYVKPLGRTYFIEDTLWLAFSGAGAEFHFSGKKAVITLLGDSTAKNPDNDGNYARVAVYVNGERVADELMNEAEKTIAVWESDTVEDCTVKIVKLSETAMSTLGIKSIEVEAAGAIAPTEEKEHFIEFIGDSITCGYGVDDEVAEHHFSTATEDVTRAYAYKTAEALDADYSMVSISGYGIISGYTAEGEKKITAQTLPQYYDKLGFSYGRYKWQTPADITWDFTGRQPDVIVLNLGTNDDSYTLDFPERQEEYRAAYVEFLKVIRSHNPEAKILCVLGIMGDRLYPVVEKAVTDYTAETKDTNIASMRFEEQKAADGYVADWHPTAVTHDKAAEKLTAYMKELMGW